MSKSIFIYSKGTIYDITELYIPRPPYEPSEVHELNERYLQHVPANLIFEVISSHTFTEGQQVVEGVDYELQFQKLIVNYDKNGDKEWIHCLSTDYDTTRALKRIVALPVNKSINQGAEEILKKHIPNYNDKNHVWKVYLRGDMTDNITQLILAAMHDFAEQGK